MRDSMSTRYFRMPSCVSYGRPASGEAVGSTVANDCDFDEWITYSALRVEPGEFHIPDGKPGQDAYPDIVLLPISVQQSTVPDRARSTHKSMRQCRSSFKLQV